jgi:serine/threonine-protein kinase
MPSANLLESKLVWGRDTFLQPIASLNKSLLKKMGGNSGDYVLSLKNSRAHSKRISSDAKLFLDEFEKPALMLQAVMNHAEKNKLDEQQLLTKVYPLVQSLLSNDFLEYADKKITTERKQLFSKDESVNGYRIISCIQFLDDTESYKAVDQEGKFVLLKIVFNKSGILKHNFNNETAILQLLNKQPNDFVPGIMASISGKKYSILVIEWLDGTNLWEIVKSGTISFSNKARLILSVIDAYQFIHQQGILHADIHPNNIIVDKEYRAKLIDFGAAINTLVPGKFDVMARAGVIGFYEPELVDSILKNKGRIIATQSGEQYQLAALLYQLITGEPYLTLSFETKPAFKQILKDTPRPFADFKIKAPQIEKILAKALMKKPSERYQTITTFYQDLRKYLPHLAKLKDKIIIENKPASLHGPGLFENCIVNFVKEFGLDSAKINSAPWQKPFSSIFHGEAGIAYTFLRLSYIKNDPQLLALAAVWISKAKQATNKKGAFENPQIDMPISTIGFNSFYHQLPGVLLVDTLVEYALGNNRLSVNAALKLVDRLKKGPGPSEDDYLLDPTQGPAGLLGAMPVLQTIGKNMDGFPMEQFENISAEIIASLIPAIHENISASVDRTKNKLLGYAHGYAGLMHAVLQGSGLINDNQLSLLYNALIKLSSFGINSGNTICWPVGINDSAIWLGWCHGSAGHMLLWMNAYRKFNDRLFLNNAVKTGEYLWNNYSVSNTSICCGLAGQSVALYQLGKLLNDKKWYDRGLKLAALAIKSENKFLLKDSLFQGAVGLALLAGESLEPNRSLWPISGL